MLDDFDWCVNHTIDAYEGGYSNDANDPGGPTKYGITQHDYSVFRGRTVTATEVKAMPREDAVKIYETKYGPPIHFPELPRGPDYCMYDYGVHSGVGRPVRVAQAILGLTQTGRVDSVMIDKLKGRDPVAFVNAMCDERDHFLRGIKGGAQYQRFPGWGKRVKDIRRVCLGLIEKPGTRPDPGAPLPNSPRGKHAPDPKTKKDIIKGTAGGTVATQTAHLWTSVDTALILGGVAVIGGAAAYFAYVRWHNQANLRVELPNFVTPAVPPIGGLTI